jgi:hypothetical protein
MMGTVFFNPVLYLTLRTLSHFFFLLCSDHPILVFSVAHCSNPFVCSGTREVTPSSGCIPNTDYNSSILKNSDQLNITWIKKGKEDIS